jgi:HK97 family phage portal protein
MHPTRVEVGLVTDDELAYRLTPANAAPVPLKQDEVLHTRWLSDNSRVGMVPFELCGPALSLARKLDEAALAYWDNGGRPDVVLETDETIPAQARKEMKSDWAADHSGAGNRGKIAVLPRKVKLREVTGNTAEAMQFIELRDSIVPDIARVYGIPSTLLGDHRMAKYSNSEQEFLTAFVFCLMPWALRLESAITRCLLQGYGEDIYCKVDGRGLLRGDTASRMALYQSLFNMGSITPNEIRELEDLEPLDEEAADETYMQLGFSTLAAAAAGTVDTNTAGGTTDGNP